MIAHSLKQQLCEIFKKDPSVEKVLLFGSYARETQDAHSDLDLFAIQKTDERFFDRLKDVEREIVANLKLYPEILSYTPEEFEKIKERPFIQTVLREGLTIYERGEK